ncbi:MAG: hypothetical protein V3R96_02895 [Dehalococcoidales bacterium]
MPYLAELEKAGIPTVLIDLSEETEKIRHDAFIYGVPQQRLVEAARITPGPEAVEEIFDDVIGGLLRPLTDEEKESGKWAPEEPRILFEGTLDAAETFYDQSENIAGILNAPFALYTDGLPIRVPTEERVKEMLTGTSHKPDEIITLQNDTEMRGVGGERGFTQKKGDVVKFMPMGRTATVEQVAINAVMAGCKPEYFPVVLAIAESGGGTGDGRGGGGAFMVSGPIVKEIGINVSYGRFSIGNPPNKTIGRVGSLLWRNLGGYKETVSTIMTYGSPVTNGGFILGEYAEALPSGWKGLNEEFGYKKNESIIMTTRPGSWGIGQEHMPGVYRSLQKSGHGAIARFLDVKGIPGPHNYMEFISDGIWRTMEGGFTLVLVPQMAQDMFDYGFKSKDEIYEWMWKRSFEPVKEYRMRGRPDFHTNGWTAIERTSGKHWKELDDDYMVPAGGNGPWEYCIIVCDGQETASARFSGGHGQAFNIDTWR